MRSQTSLFLNRRRKMRSKLSKIFQLLSNCINRNFKAKEFWIICSKQRSLHRGTIFQIQIISIKRYNGPKLALRLKISEVAEKPSNYYCYYHQRKTKEKEYNSRKKLFKIKTKTNKKNYQSKRLNGTSSKFSVPQYIK